jgi:hypothetical protein
LKLFGFEWLGGLPSWIRYGVAGVLLLLGTLFFLGGSIWACAGTWSVGFAMLVFSGPSDSEKKGYNF